MVKFMAEKEPWKGPLEKIDEYRWKIPQNYMPGMRVPGMIYASEQLLEHIKQEQVLQQVANVACLPGIVKYSLAMPDIHWGYGLPIGGVAATDIEEGGVISPGGVGYDINCGVRLLRTNLRWEEVKNYLPELVNALYSNIPAGVGSRGIIRLSREEEKKVLVKGSRWAVEKGYGWREDVDYTEEHGCLAGADPEKLTSRSLERGLQQVGTLGGGNHFLEVQVVEELFDSQAARLLSLEKGQITVMIHSGSRGLGYQICDDSLGIMRRAMGKYGITLPDQQLACAPLKSPEGKDYFAAMAAAANYAWANRQCLMHWVREIFEKVFRASAEKLEMFLIYDVAHNIAKLEEHVVNGRKVQLCVHRKGATRAFPPQHPVLPTKYQTIGQPVLIPGDMGRSSYLLVGTETAMRETFGSTCHGAGRVLSRTAAMKVTRGRSLQRELEEKGILVRARELDTLREEAPEAYKNVTEVVRVVHEAGISRRIAQFRPVGVIKG